MRPFRALLLLPFALLPQPAAAQVNYDGVTAGKTAALGAGGLEALAPAPIPQGIADFGPFRVVDGAHAALINVTDTASPAAFAAMLRAYPRISVLSLIDCPGTEDDLANLQLGLMIRRRQLVTHVPDGGLVASGAVELFLAGARRYAEPGAKFVVHAWKDTSGREPRDYPRSAPKNQSYLAYYRIMGLSEAEAQAFYAMTNSVPFAEEKWLTRDDLARWVRLDSMPDHPPAKPAPSHAARNSQGRSLR